MSDRDCALLHSVGGLRLATSRHLEALHFFDAATPLTAARKARRTLHRLSKLGLLRRLERQIGGLHAGSAAYIYALTSAGQRVAAVEGSRNRLSEPSWLFVTHTLAVADLYVALHREVRAGERGVIELLDPQTEPACWRRWTTVAGSQEVLRPDLYLAAAIGSDEVRWFVEVDCGTEHRPTLVRKARAYQRYYDSGTEQARDEIFPRVAWVVPNEVRARQLGQALASDTTLTPDLFAVLLMESAAEQLVA